MEKGTADSRQEKILKNITDIHKEINNVFKSKGINDVIVKTVILKESSDIEKYSRGDCCTLVMNEYGEYELHCKC